MTFTTIKTTFSLSATYFLQGKFKDTKGVIRIRKSKKDRQYNGQKKDRQYNGQKKDRQYNGQKKKDKMTNNDGQNRKLKLERKEQHESH